MKRVMRLGASASVVALGACLAAAAAAEENAQVRRDEAGIKGVSPFWELVKKGDAAFIAGDYDEAKSHFENAIKKDTRNPLGHTRIAQVLLAKGELDAAFARLESARGFANKVELRAKIVFLQGSVRERQSKLDQAKRSWLRYGELAAAKKAKSAPAKDGDQPTAAKETNRTHSESATERIRQIDAAKERAAGYAVVKERIEKREKELDDKARGKS